MRFGPAGRTIDHYPAGVQPSDIDLEALRNGRDTERQPRVARLRGGAGDRRAQGANERGVLAVVVLDA